MRLVLFLFVLFLVNFPYARETWIDHKVANDGHDVAATVIDARAIQGDYLVDYRLPKSEDPGADLYSASVDLPTYEQAQAADVIAVRVISGDPRSNRPLGLVPSSLFTVAALAGDVVLAAVAVLAWYRRRRPDLLSM